MGKVEGWKLNLRVDGEGVRGVEGEEGGTQLGYCWPVHDNPIHLVGVWNPNLHGKGVEGDSRNGSDENLRAEGEEEGKQRVEEQ